MNVQPHQYQARDRNIPSESRPRAASMWCALKLLLTLRATMGAWLAPVSRVLTRASASLRRLDCEAGNRHDFLDKCVVVGCIVHHECHDLDVKSAYRIKEFKRSLMWPSIPKLVNMSQVAAAIFTPVCSPSSSRKSIRSSSYMSCQHVLVTWT